MKLNFNYLNENQRTSNNILYFILEDRVKTILKRVKSLRNTKTYLKYKESGLNVSFDIIGTDFKGLMFELKSLEHELNFIQNVLNKSNINLFLDFEREYINNYCKG